MNVEDDGLRRLVVVARSVLPEEGHADALHVLDNLTTRRIIKTSLTISSLFYAQPSLSFPLAQAKGSKERNEMRGRKKD
jgi:hypothetical protein